MKRFCGWVPESHGKPGCGFSHGDISASRQWVACHALGGTWVEVLTCQRAEWYFHTDGPLSRPALPGRILHDSEALSHLLHVACACDSLLVGETQILGQVRHAVVCSRREGRLSADLDHLFQRVISAGRRAQAQKPDGLLASLAELAVQIVAGDLPAPRLLVVGTGQTAQLAAGAALARGWSVTVVGRDSARTARAVLATKAWGASWANLAGLVAGVDAVIAAQKVAAGDGPTVLPGLVSPTPRMWIDLSSPRCIHPGIGSVADQRLLTLADLARHVPPAQQTYLATAKSIIRTMLPVAEVADVRAG